MVPSLARPVTPTPSPEDLEGHLHLAHAQRAQGQVRPQLLLGALQLPPQAPQPRLGGDALALAVGVLGQRGRVRERAPWLAAAPRVLVGHDVVLLDLLAHGGVLVVGGGEEDVEVLLVERKIGLGIRFQCSLT